MQRMPLSVLIVHNIPRTPITNGNVSQWSESDTGVLDQVAAVSVALERLRIPFRSVGVKELRDLPRILAGSSEKVAFNLVESLTDGPLEMNSVPTVCRAYGKTCTGGDALCLAMSADKWLTKALLQGQGLPCPQAFFVPIGAKFQRAKSLKGPFIVKPELSDASEGIDADSVVKNSGAKLQAAIRRVHENCKQAALVERFVDGREINVSLLQCGERVEVLPLAEINFTNFGDRPRIVDYAAKWIEDSHGYNNTNRIIPAPLPRRAAESIRRIALEAWRALNCQDYARVDFRLDEKNRPFVLEINSNPDISPTAGYAAALQAAGISYERFIRTLLRNAEGRVPNPIPIKQRFPQRAEKTVCRIRIRRSSPSDCSAILGLLMETGNFRPDELKVAKEVLDDALAKGARGHYQSYVVDEDGSAAAWVCFGPTPCTLGSFDIYWLASSPRFQRRGFGRALMQNAESLIRKHKGRLAVVETSSRPEYNSARSFYLKCGYYEAARVRDFYAPGDDKIIYLKDLRRC